MFKQNKIYILEGWVFCENALKDNDGRFYYNGRDSDESHEFIGVSTGAKQWISDESLCDEDDPIGTVVPA